MTLSETHVCADVEQVELSIVGYRMEQCVTTNRRTGGVLMLMRSEFKYKFKTVQCVDNFVWMLSVEIYMFRIRYLFTFLYHPPQTETARFVQFFRQYLGLKCVRWSQCNYGRF